MKQEQGKDIGKREAQIKKLLSEIEAHKKSYEQQGLTYTVLDEDQLRQKLNRAKSPMIISQGWSSTSPGGTFNYSVGIFNPDPGPWSSLFAYVFVGPANSIASVGQALATVDTRFPQLTMPRVFGLTLAPNESQSLSYSISVPASVQRSNYQGNTFLQQASWHDVGTHFDRSTFVFEVT